LLRQTNNTTVSTFTPNDLNQLTGYPSNTQHFDRRGNLFQRAHTTGEQRYFVYDHENQLIEVRTDAFYTAEVNRFKEEYKYDGRGRLRERRSYTHVSGNWSLGSVTRYVYDGMLIVQERSPTLPSVTYTRGVDLSGTLSGAGGIGGLLGRSTGYAIGTGLWSTHTSYQADGNGNVTAILESGGNLMASYHYNPWGGLLGITGAHATANTMRHSSKPWMSWRGSNSAGLYYYGYRFYDPTTMKWVNRDPIGEAGGLNLYGFCGNDPIAYIDPDGELVHAVVIVAGVGIMAIAAYSAVTAVRNGVERAKLAASARSNEFDVASDHPLACPTKHSGAVLDGLGDIDFNDMAKFPGTTPGGPIVSPKLDGEPRKLWDLMSFLRGVVTH
jgi:RHS repeat-associated protein